MTKIVLDAIVSTQNVQKINSNFEKIAEELNTKSLSRKPEGEPNFLQEDLDLNNKRILNIAAPVSDTDLVRKMDIQEIASPDLSSKQDTLVSGVNIKTINNESVLGSGNLTIAGVGGSNDHNTLLNRNIPDQHIIDSVTGLQSSLDSKAPVSHTHDISDVTGLQTELDGKADSSHTHSIANVTGLQSALDAKQATLVSATNIKTINGASILGSGDLVISGGGSSDWVAQTGAFTAAVNTSYYVTTSSLIQVTLATPSAGKYFSISNDAASTSNIRILKSGITVVSARGTIVPADSILLVPGQHFLAYATSATTLRIPLNG